MAGLIGDVDDLAREAYLAYGESTGGLNVRGEQLPDWDDLGPEVRNAWRASTQRVLDRAGVRVVSDDDA